MASQEQAAAHITCHRMGADSTGFPCTSPLHSRRTGFEVDRIPSLLEAPREMRDPLTMPAPVNIGGAAFPIWLMADEDIQLSLSRFTVYGMLCLH